MSGVLSRTRTRTRTRVARVPVRQSLSFARRLAALILAGTVGPAWAQPTPPLPEAEAIRGALSRPAWLDAQAGRVAQAESTVTEAALLPNPTLTLGRERIGTAGGNATERTVQVSQTFDVSGRRALRREAASQRLDAARLGSQDRRLATIAEVRQAFAETLHRERTKAAAGRWFQRIEAATLVVAQLAQAGEVSGYDRRRFEREAQTARARLSGARADAMRSRERLAALAGKQPEEVTHLAGELLPEAPPTLDTAQAGLRRRPDLASLVAQADAFERERQAAERGWIPDLTLGIGQKRVEESGRNDSGLVLGVSVAIPLFDRGQAAEQRSRAQAQTLRAEHALSLARAEAELRGVWHQAAELRQAGEAFRQQSLTSSRELSHIAEAAYRAGEASLLELLDAYRAELDAETTALDLALRARLARIELDTLSGAPAHE
jgi:cobalt-zinc-cadmium efflux system outer membrane protein